MKLLSYAEILEQNDPTPQEIKYDKNNIKGTRQFEEGEKLWLQQKLEAIDQTKTELAGHKKEIIMQLVDHFGETYDSLSTNIDAGRDAIKDQDLTGQLERFTQRLNSKYNGDDKLKYRESRIAMFKLQHLATKVINKCISCGIEKDTLYKGVVNYPPQSQFDGILGLNTALLFSNISKALIDRTPNSGVTGFDGNITATLIDTMTKVANGSINLNESAPEVEYSKITISDKGKNLEIEVTKTTPFRLKGSQLNTEDGTNYTKTELDGIRNLTYNPAATNVTDARKGTFAEAIDAPEEQYRLLPLSDGANQIEIEVSTTPPFKLKADSGFEAYDNDSAEVYKKQTAEGTWYITHDDTQIAAEDAWSATFDASEKPSDPDALLVKAAEILVKGAETLFNNDELDQETFDKANESITLIQDQGKRKPFEDRMKDLSPNKIEDSNIQNKQKIDAFITEWPQKKSIIEGNPKVNQLTYYKDIVGQLQGNDGLVKLSKNINYKQKEIAVINNTALLKLDNLNQELTKEFTGLMQAGNNDYEAGIADLAGSPALDTYTTEQAIDETIAILQEREVKLNDAQASFDKAIVIFNVLLEPKPNDDPHSKDVAGHLADIGEKIATLELTKAKLPIKDISIGSEYSDDIRTVGAGIQNLKKATTLTEYNNQKVSLVHQILDSYLGEDESDILDGDHSTTEKVFNLESGGKITYNATSYTAEFNGLDGFDNTVQSLPLNGDINISIDASGAEKKMVFNYKPSDTLIEIHLQQ